MSGNGNGLIEEPAHVLSRAASRRDLAATLHGEIIPILKNHEHNLLWMKDKIESLEARIAALEPKTEA